METQLVYRLLRKISDWTLAGFYSEVYISGTENVPKDGPLILTPSHHNEIIDIAAVAATIPYRRHVSFWAKSTMFVNPITRAILVSSGSIPVKRNPNKTADSQTLVANGNGKTLSVTSNQELFKDSFVALAKGKVLGVFPEGTSYTEPCMAQLMSGAAWAAVEYEKWRGKGSDGGNGLRVVPVAIVYTDKSKYRSRVVIHYGKAIQLSDYTHELFQSPAEGDDEVTRTLVKKVMADVERQLLDATINAPNWDTIYAARIARDMLWARSEIPLKSFVQISQCLVDTLSPTRPDSAQSREALVKYYSLLHYTNLSHETLNDIYPDEATTPTPLKATGIVFKQLCRTLLHPRFFLFLPVFFLHRPSYMCAALAARFLANKEEEEGQAQFKAIFGGFGSGISYAMVTWKLSSWLRGLASQPPQTMSSAWSIAPRMLRLLRTVGGWFVHERGAFRGRRVVATLALFYATSWVLVHWHNLLIDGNYKAFKRLLASFRLLRGSTHGFRDLSPDEVAPYSRPKPPPFNPFIKRRASAASIHVHREAEITTNPRQPSRNALPSRRLVGPLLLARVEATRALTCLWDSADALQKGLLLRSGASL
ncbi:hypothetical protein ONZ45_g12051 [Pleurotus djamor]|nr:hypothetical protein ONZ45_g12051 [Pleurotus djamor]